MSTLESLRKRSGLLVSIVGIALFAFVLTGLFEQGSVFGNDNSVGEIAGKEINYVEFNNKVEEAKENKKRSEGKSSLTDEDIYNVVKNVWNGYIHDEVMLKEYEKVGVTVSGDELYDMMVDNPTPLFLRNITDPNTGRVVEAFAGPDGRASSEKLRNYMQNMGPDQEKQWVNLEEYVKANRVREKYSAIIKKGMYVTKAEAKRIYEENNVNTDVDFLAFKFSTIANTSVEYTQRDIDEYYAAHKNEFKQEDSRSIEYVAFDIIPSEEDKAKLLEEMRKVAVSFAATESKEDDSVLVIAESDTRMFDERFYVEGTLSPNIDSVMFHSAPGKIVGPYLENGSLKVSKLIATKYAADSAKVRHILIAHNRAGLAVPVTRTIEEAKVLADSLKGVLQKNRSRFAELVNLYSDDSGKENRRGLKEGEYYQGKGGEYDWFNSESGFVESFKNAGLDGKKGDLLVVESQFGYHIIEVLNTGGRVFKAQVATIERKQEPSNKTMQSVFAKASAFAGKNKSESLFNEAVAQSGLSKRVVRDLKAGDRSIPGIPNSKELVRWAYDHELGEVSSPKDFGNRFIVAVVTGIKEAGVPKMEDIQEELVSKVILEKKKALIINNINGALAEGITINSLASKLNTEVKSASMVNFNTNTINGVGSDNQFIATAASINEPGKLTKPIVGKLGVYVLVLKKEYNAPAQEDYTYERTDRLSQLQSRSDYELYEALKGNADIVERYYKFY